MILLLAWMACVFPPEGSCGADADCGFASSCVEGQCTDHSCASSAQCPMEEHCEDGACEAGCAEDGDCYAGDYCDAPGTPDATCAAEGCIDTRLDCAFNEFCDLSTATCVDAGGAYCDVCDTDADCGGGGNACVDLGVRNKYCGVSCTADEDCPNGYACIEVDNAEGTITSHQCMTWCWLYE